ncbi:MAG: Rne/Rng family ribonuclease, partial [Candidatus Omnitrophica bacterium]|nr:Rne/Rng family ribonuclease [Candidatus Omnitrophota bacterium]
PYCEGKGMVKSATTMSIQTVRELRKTLEKSQGRIVNAYVHPQVAQRLMEQERKALQLLERQKHSRIFIFSEPSMHIEDVNITFVK